MDIGISLLVLLLAIIVHEALHALVAAWVDLRVRTVGVGLRLPPKIEGVTKGGVYWWISVWLVAAMVSPYPMPPQKTNLLTSIKRLPESMEDSRFLYEKPWKRAVVVIAGPLANLILAFTAPMLLFGTVGVANGLKFIGMVNSELFDSSPTFGTLVPPFNESLVEWAFAFYYINLGLAIFNLLPIPPVDGGHLLLAFLDWVWPVEGEEKRKRIKWANLVALAVTGVLMLAGVIVIGSLLLRVGTNIAVNLY